VYPVLNSSNSLENQSRNSVSGARQSHSKPFLPSRQPEHLYLLADCLFQQGNLRNDANEVITNRYPYPSPDKQDTCVNEIISAKKRETDFLRTKTKQKMTSNL